MTLIEAAPSAAVASSPPGSRPSVARGRRAPSLLALVVAALALAASLAGLLVEGIYTGDAATAEMFRGYDLVTAVLAVPVLAVAALLARRGALWPRLVVTSLLAYVVYTYAYYLFGTGFNDLFLLHVAVFAIGLAALVLSFAALDVEAVAEAFSPRARVRTIAGILGVLAVALGAMWVGVAAANALTGAVPAGSALVETETIVRLGMALDLALLVPLYAVAAVLLWRRRGWGFVLSAVALIAGVLHQVSYVVAMPFQVAAGVPGAVAFDPYEPVIVLLYMVAAVLLVLGGRRSTGRRPRTGDPRRGDGPRRPAAPGRRG